MSMYVSHRSLQQMQACHIWMSVLPVCCSNCSSREEIGAKVPIKAERLSLVVISLQV